MKMISIRSLVVRHKSESGMASLVVVSMLVIILTLVSVGFARIMDRSLNSSVSNQLGSAAYYAARSGINDATAYLSAYPNTSASHCNDLVGQGKPLDGQLSGDENVKYTCVLINQKPTSLEYQNVPASKSQVVKLKAGNGSLDSVMLSWQANDASVTELVKSGANAKDLLSQTAWTASNYQPMIRITLYPINNLITGSLKQTQNDSKTFFIIPTTGGTKTINMVADKDASLFNVQCDKAVIGGFPGTPDYACSVVINNLDSASIQYYYARITPLYQNADLKIKGSVNGGNAAQFADAQAVLDVTAKANDSFRRLVARVDTSGVGGTPVNIDGKDDSIPEYAVRSAGTLCKRMSVGTTITTMDASINPHCFVPAASQSPPLVTTNDPTNFTTTSVTFNGTVRSQLPFTYYFEYRNCVVPGKVAPPVPGGLVISGACDTNDPYGTFHKVPGSDGSNAGSVNPVNVSALMTGLSPSSSYSVRLVATNTVGTTNGNIKHFWTLSPYITSFSQPASGVCTARYGGAPNPDNCYDWTGGNLPSQCSIAILSYKNGAATGAPQPVPSNPTYGSSTAGNSRAAWAVLTCGIATATWTEPVPHLTTFNQPSDADCSARYGFAHPNNCYDWTGSNLTSCSMTLYSYRDGHGAGTLPASSSVPTGPNGGSATFGDNNAGFATLTCDGMTLSIFSTSPPPPPPAGWGSRGVTYFGNWRLKQVSNGLSRPSWCASPSPAYHVYILCAQFTTYNVPLYNPAGCTVSWDGFVETQYNGITSALELLNPIILGWPGQPPSFQTYDGSFIGHPPDRGPLSLLVDCNVPGMTAWSWYSPTNSVSLPSGYTSWEWAWFWDTYFDPNLCRTLVCN